MKTRQFRNRVGGALLAFSLLFGIYTTSNVTAQAQWPYGQNDQYRRNRDYQREQIRRQREYERQQRREQRRIARTNGGYYGGYNNGGYYGNNDGYYGNNGGYTRDGYGNFGGSLQLRQTALNAGANEGVKEGRRDRERGEGFNYNDESTYQDATKDYSSRLGDRYVYQQYFRQAFINGYTEGYRGY